MSEANDGVSKEKEILRAAKQKGGLAIPLAYLKCSGPGFLQGAITLGGGSLAGSLYLGVLGGYSMLWLQLLAMFVGIIMLSAITYVTLSTGKSPFKEINQHINPVLGWGWALATLTANIVWCLPQFSLGSAAVKQNLLGNMVNAEGLWVIGSLTPDQSTWVVCGAILAIATIVIWFYDTGGNGIKLFELILKLMVAGIVLCFFGVVVQMALKGALDWDAIGKGLIPNLKLLSEPAPTFQAALDATGQFSDFWKGMIVDSQRDKMITAAATAVGINMTFLLPYSMLRKGWDRESRGLAIFDLSIGLAIPFIIATSCVVIASAAQFHTKPEPAALDGSDKVMAGNFQKNLKKRLANELGTERMAELEARAAMGSEAEAMLQKENLSTEEKTALEKLVPLKTVVSERLEKIPDADRQLAAMLVDRDAFQLASSLKTLTGNDASHYIFGIGVLGMAVSSIIILMLISGFTVCEVFGLPHTGWFHRFGCMLPAIGVAGPFLFTGEAKFWMAVPTSVFGWTLLPIAYLSFFLLINNKKVMGDQRLRGFGGFLFNLLMFVGVIAVAMGAAWTVWAKAKWVGVGIVSFFFLLAFFVHFARKQREASAVAASGPHETDEITSRARESAPQAKKIIKTAPAPAPNSKSAKEESAEDEAPVFVKPGDVKPTQEETVMLTKDDFAKSAGGKPVTKESRPEEGATVFVKPGDVKPTQEETVMLTKADFAKSADGKAADKESSPEEGATVFVRPGDLKPTQEETVLLRPEDFAESKAAPKKTLQPAPAPLKPLAKPMMKVKPTLTAAPKPKATESKDSGYYDPGTLGGPLL